MTLRNILRFGALAATGALTACQPPVSEADQFRRGVPREETVKVTVPGGKAGQALTIDQGKPSEFLSLTYGVTSLINGGAFFVGGLVKAVLAFPPTNITGDTATWGPWHGDIEPIDWKVTVTRVGDHQFHYEFAGRSRTQPNAPFVTVLAGTHDAATDDGGDPVEGFGAGSFTIDWDARQTLPAPPKDVGKASYTYSRPSPAVDATIGAQFRQVRDDDTKKLIDVDYAYVHHAAGGGSMDFTYDAAKQMPPGKWTVRSRWQSSGAGRADVRATSPDLPAGATVNDCWNTSFASMFRRVSWDTNAGYGNEATDCVFTSAEYSKLP